MEKVTIYKDYITPEQETLLLSQIEEAIAPYKRTTYFVQRYVFGTKYNSNFANPIIPDFLQAIANQLLSEGKVEGINSVVINKYLPGQGMHPHWDGDGVYKVITSLSLKASGTLVFSKEGEENISFEEPPRTLLQFSEDAKNTWKHEVLPVEEERISIIFRKIIPITE